MKTLLFYITITLSLLHSAAAQFNNAGSSGMQFLKIITSARGAAMGGASGSLTGDLSSLPVNPASIGTITHLSLSTQHTSWVEQTDINFIGLVVPLSDQVNLGFHTSYLTSGGIEITTIETPEGTGQLYDVSDIAVGITGSVRLTAQLTFAATVKYLQERIYDVSTDGVALDAGMWYETGFKSLNIGFSLANLGFEQRFTGKPLEVRYSPADPAEPLVRAELQTLRFPIPLSFRASGSFDLLEMFDERRPGHRFLTVIDFIQNSDTRERAIIGTEYGWNDLLFLRGGYVFNADEAGFSGGAGLLLTLGGTDIRIDGAASSHGRFGLFYRLGLTLTAR